MTIKKPTLKKPIELYINVSAEEHVVVLSGIKVVDFIENTPIKIKNILLLKSEYFATKNFCGFELLEGYDDISELLREDISSYEILVSFSIKNLFRAIAIFQFIVGGFAARRRKRLSVLAKTPTTENKIVI